MNPAEANPTMNRLLRTCIQMAMLLCLTSQLLLPTAVARTSVTQAIRQAQQTGKPIFAVAGASYCPACQKLMNTLNSDESLQPYIEQFVPLKINAQSDDYQRWKQFFPPKKSAIPALFIVTPQGKEVYSAVGALPTERLQKVLLTSLQKAERYPTKSQWKEITETLAAAEQALDEEQITKAAELLQPVFTQLVEMRSLLELEATGRETIKHVNQLVTKQRTLLDESLQSLESKGDLASALDVTALQGLLELLPEQRKTVSLAIKKAVRNAEQKKLLRQAKELLQAESLSKQPDAKSQRKALAAYKRLVKRYPDSEAAEQAEERLEGFSD